MTSQVSPLVPSRASLPALRIIGWALTVGAIGLIVEAADLSRRGHGPVVVPWALLLTGAGLLGVAVGFITITPASGGLGSRLRQQSVRYKTAGCVALLALAADISLCIVGTAHLG